MKKNTIRGAAMADYSILVGLIALGAIGAVVSTGDEVADVFCEASDRMTYVPGIERQERCIVNPNDRIKLAPDERFVDPETPAQMQTDFSDVMFEKSETGDRLVFSEFTEAPATSFWLDTQMASRNPHEAQRFISSCYMLGGGVDPICGTAGTSSAVSVPASATAMGYAISLSDNLEMPWENDVTISIPPSEGVDAQNWTVEVAREESDPIVKDVTVSFASHVYEQTDSGWTMGAFAPIEGTFNQTLRFTLQNIPNNGQSRKACFIPSAGADPICSSSTQTNTAAAIDVAPGAVSLGYEIFLPDVAPGPDWVSEEILALHHGQNELSANQITITRPNEPIATGGLNGSFSDPYSFAQTDTGLTEVEFIPLNGPRNIDLTWEVYERDDNYNFKRAACYKLENGAEECSIEYAGEISIEVPPEAVSIGYKIDLPEEKIGPDYSLKTGLTLTGGNETLVNQTHEAIRPNEPYATGGLAGSFSDPYSFAQTDTGWTEGEFVELEGPRNVDLTWELTYNDGRQYYRKACYKLADGEKVCSDTEFYTKLTIDVPPEAVSVGYEFDLPDEAIGAAYTGEYKLELSGPEVQHLYLMQDVIRPNEPYQTGGLAGSFSDPYSFAQTDTGWTEGEFVELEGPRNTDLTWEVTYNDGRQYYRKACYKLADGEKVCSDTQFYNKLTIDVPPEAVSVGYEFDLPDEAIGPAFTGEYKLTLTGPDGGRHLYLMQDVIRPNEPYATGGLAGSFSDPYSFAQTDTGWKESEFVALEGPRNVNLTWEFSYNDGRRLYRKACYKLADGEKSCSAAEINAKASISVPPEAVSIGYEIELPDEAIGPDMEGEYLLKLSGPGVQHLYLMQDVIRPNEPYQRGGLAGSFTQPYSFAQTDTGWKESEFVALEGPRNINLTWEVNHNNGRKLYRKACYKLADGEKVCSDQEINAKASISVPPEAASIGYELELPDEAIGPDMEGEYLLKLNGANVNLLFFYHDIVRPNEPYNTGALLGSFSTQYAFEEGDTGEKVVEYVDISQPRNVALSWEVSRQDNHTNQRAACYKLADGHEECSAFQQVSAAVINVPVEAVSVGYKIVLPAPSIGDDTTIRNLLKLEGARQSLAYGVHTLSRPNESRKKGDLAAAFDNPFIFENGETGTQVAQFINFTGPRNVGSTFTVYRVDKHGHMRQACYRMADGQEECSNASNYYDVSIFVPPTAVSVGYKTGVPAPGTSYQNDIRLSGSGEGGENFPYGRHTITNQTPQP